MNRLFERKTLIKMDGSFNMVLNYLQSNAVLNSSEMYKALNILRNFLELYISRHAAYSNFF